MPEAAPPSLNEDQIRYISMPPNYKRGVRNYLSDAITNLVRQGPELWAEYRRKDIGGCSYQIHATLGGEDGIETSTCTCSYGQEAKEYDLCPHQIAVLYRYLYDPLAFHVIPSLTEMLASHSRDDLFALIGQLVQNQPKLLVSVELANAQLLSSQSVDASAYRLQAQCTVQHSDMQKTVKDSQMSLEAAQAPKQAVQLISAAQNPKAAWGYREGPIKHHRHDKSQTALEQQQKIFCTSPCLKSYEALRDVAQLAGSWRKTRNSVLASLEYGQHFGMLIEIALHENNIERALELLPKLTAKSQPCHQLRVVPPIERTQQRAAIAFHEKFVEKLISQRKRDKYKFAVKHLQRMKERYELLQEQVDWETYFQRLRSQYPNLPALQEELNEAKL